MRKSLAIAAAAVLTVSGFTYAGDMKDTGNVNNERLNNVGATTQPSPQITAATPTVSDTHEIQGVLASTVDAAVTKNNLDSIVGMLTKADRDRIGSGTAVNTSDLDGRIDQFQKDWQAKYGQDFKLSDKAAAIFGEGNAKIVKGGPTSADARVAADKLPPNTVPPGNEEIDPAIIQHDKSAVNGLVKTAAEQNGVPKFVTVELPGAQNSAGTTLRLTNEGALVNAWKYDVNDSYDAAKLHDELLNRLTKLDEGKASWPTDVNQAYTAVSHELLGIFGESNTNMGNTPAATPNANQ